jgi:hypothetical protein
MFWQESGCAYFINQRLIEHARLKWAWSHRVTSVHLDGHFSSILGLVSGDA